MLCNKGLVFTICFSRAIDLSLLRHSSTLFGYIRLCFDYCQNVYDFVRVKNDLFSRNSHHSYTLLNIMLSMCTYTAYDLAIFAIIRGAHSCVTLSFQCRCNVCMY